MTLQEVKVSKLLRDRGTWFPRLAHNQEHVGSNPTPATNIPTRS